MRGCFRAVLMGVLAVLLMLPVLQRSADAVEYSFGVVPQFEQRRLYSVWKPIIDELEKRTGLKFNLTTTLQVVDFEKEFMKGAFDFAYMNPYIIARTAETLKYIPLVRDRQLLRGMLVVRKDGPIQMIGDLNGKIAAFPTPNSLAGCMLMKADLKTTFGVTVVPVYVKTVSNCYLHVAKGLAEAAGVPDKSLPLLEPSIRDMLRVLHQTQAIPPHPIAAHPRVGKWDREKVRKALLDMAKTAEGKELLSKVPMHEAVAAKIEEYLAIRKMGLDPYFDPTWKGE